MKIGPNILVAPLAVIVQVGAGASAVAQPAVVVPGQVSQLPPSPVAPKAIPDLRIGRAPAAADEPGGPSLTVRALRITGQTRFSEAQLLAATGFTPGQSLSLGDLRRMAALITDYYNRRGFIVAQAYVPAQELSDGVVTIAVIEGRYGDVKVNSQSRLRNGVAQGIVRGLDSGDPVAAAPLQRRLLLLSDLPGVGVRSTLSPGSEVGTSDLMIDVTPGRRITGNLEVDNAGNPYTGVYQGGGTITLNEPFGIGDAASVRVLTSGTGLQYVRGSYQAQWRDVSLGASYTYFHYRLGRQFSALHADGSEQIASVYAGYPLIRSYDNNLQLLVSAEYRTFTDNIDAIRAVTDRRAEVVTIGLNGDHHDTFGGGGWDAYSLYLTGGNLDLQTRLARDVDAATARTDGGYGKLRFSLDRLQRVQGPFSLYASIRGQVAFKNLDISEKMELGGAYAVRAYPEGEAYGDEGYVATAEGRVRLPKPTWLPGQLQFAGFYDAGWVRYVKTPWFTGSNSATRSGAGVGLTWVNDNKFQASASYAFRLSRPATSSPGGDGQFWFQLVKFF